jgi:hypothetical protein
MLSYEQERPYANGTILSSGPAAAAHEYLVLSHDDRSPTWGDHNDQIGGFFQLAANKWQAFDNRENQFWEEEFASAEQCQAWLNPLLDLEADTIRELRPDQLALLDARQFTVILVGYTPAHTTAPTSATYTVVDSNATRAVAQATEAFFGAPENAHLTRLHVCAVFQGYLIPEPNSFNNQPG